MWEKIWHIPVLKKTRNFLWRVYTDSIPTKQNLLKRINLTEGNCPIWCLESKTTIHMLWNCRAANEVWLASYLMIQKSPSMMADTNQLWGFIMECMKPPDIVLTASIMRHMWSRRNDFVFNSKVGAPYCTVQTA